MLDIYIFEKNSEMYVQLKEMCLKYLIKRNYEANIYDFSEDGESDFAALYMLMLDNETEAYSRRIRSGNSQSYIVVLLGSAADLKRAVCPAISPSGFIVKPWEKEDVETALDEIYIDYMRCCESKSLGMFNFKLKAKEYTIPYEKIILFESRNKKIVVRTEIQEFEFYDTLDSVLKTVPDCFIKIHKSFVVNLTRIVSADYGAMTVEFDDGSEAFMSRTYKNELRRRLDERGEK